MIYYNRIDAFERIDVNKTSESKECHICHYWYFDFKFHPNVCNVCHDLLMMSVNLSDIAILNIKDSDYCCINSGISKSEATSLFQNINLTEKSRTL